MRSHLGLSRNQRADSGGDGEERQSECARPVRCVPNEGGLVEQGKVVHQLEEDVDQVTTYGGWQYEVLSRTARS